MTNCCATETRSGNHVVADNATHTPARRPRFDVVESGDSCTLYVDLPGAPSESIQITEQDGELRLVAGTELERPSDARLVLHEIVPPRYELRLKLPRELVGGKIGATYTNGVLELAIEKGESAKLRKIEVTRA